MKILNREQMYRADALTLERQKISSAELMERAATLAFQWLHQRLQGSPVPIYIFCGIGNNGGDGLVMARHLMEHGYHIEVYLVDYAPTRSDDFLLNLQALKDRKCWPSTLEMGTQFPELKADSIVVDAVFGIGLNRPPAPWVCDLFDFINASGANILSIDLPSGMYAEPTDLPLPTIIQAQHVLAFGAPKLSFFLPESGEAVSEWTVLDIGLDPTYMGEVEVTFQVWGAPQARGIYRPRSKFAHKGSFGHAAIVGGSRGKIGAVHLAASAALRTGAGLVTAWVPDCGILPLQSGLPEVMVRVCKGKKEIKHLPVEEGYTFGLGMGMGTGADTSSALLEWLKKQEGPMLLDADALNVISAHPAALGTLPEDCILTPHPGEFKRLAGHWENDLEKLQKALQFSIDHRCVLVLKGAHTIVFYRGKGFINSSGNPGMATAGSGDVLSGMITGLLAQGYPPLKAALFGVYLHGRAGDIAVADTGYEGLTAGILTQYIGKAFTQLFGSQAGDDTPAAG